MKPTKPEYHNAVSIAAEDIEGEFVRLPADLARWNELFAEAQGRHLEAKFKVDRLFGKLFLKYRDQSDDEDSEKPKRRTEAVVKALIAKDAGYQLAQEELVKATIEKARLFGIVDAIRAKRDSLISIGATQRAELAPTRIRDTSHNADESEDDDD